MADQLREMMRKRPRKGFWATLFCRHDWQIFSTGGWVSGWDSYFCRKCGRVTGVPHAKD